MHESLEALAASVAATAAPVAGTASPGPGAKQMRRIGKRRALGVRTGLGISAQPLSSTGLGSSLAFTVLKYVRSHLLSTHLRFLW